MPKTRTRDIQEHIRVAAKWPTIADIALDWDLPERYVRGLVERRAVECIRLDFIRINPDSWAEYMARVHRPAK